VKPVHVAFAEVRGLWPLDDKLSVEGIELVGIVNIVSGSHKRNELLSLHERVMSLLKP
jgi:hypothetical protein